jgi:hypothetical protein
MMTDLVIESFRNDEIPKELKPHIARCALRDDVIGHHLDPRPAALPFAMVETAALITFKLSATDTPGFTATDTGPIR